MSPTAPSLEAVPCNLCGSSESRIKFDSSRAASDDLRHYSATIDIYGQFGRIVQCKTCGLVYTNPRLPPGDILHNYQEQEDNEFAGENSSRSINAHFSLNTIQRFVTSGNLLDVGSAAGYFLNAARLQFQPYGVEPGKQAAEFARTQLRLQIKTGELKQAAFETGFFDVVALSDVIEHFSDPMSELKEIHRITRPDGLLYLVTPNITSLPARLMGSKWWGLRPAHLYYFSPKTIRRMLEQAGYEVVWLKSYGRVFRMSYWASRLKNYSLWITGSLRWGMNKAHIVDKLVYINTMDSMEVCARRRERP